MARSGDDGTVGVTAGLSVIVADDVVAVGVAVVCQDVVVVDSTVVARSSPALSADSSIKTTASNPSESGTDSSFVKSTSTSAANGVGGCVDDVSAAAVDETDGWYAIEDAVVSAVA